MREKFRGPFGPPWGPQGHFRDEYTILSFLLPYTTPVKKIHAFFKICSEIWLTHPELGKLLTNQFHIPCDFHSERVGPHFGSSPKSDRRLVRRDFGSAELSESVASRWQEIPECGLFRKISLRSGLRDLGPGKIRSTRLGPRSNTIFKAVYYYHYFYRFRSLIRTKLESETSYDNTEQ